MTLRNVENRFMRKYGVLVHTKRILDPPMKFRWQRVDPTLTGQAGNSTWSRTFLTMKLYSGAQGTRTRNAHNLDRVQRLCEIFNSYYMYIFGNHSIRSCKQSKTLDQLSKRTFVAKNVEKDWLTLFWVCFPMRQDDWNKLTSGDWRSIKTCSKCRNAQNMKSYFGKDFRDQTTLVRAVPKCYDCSASKRSLFWCPFCVLFKVIDSFRGKLCAQKGQRSEFRVAEGQLVMLASKVLVLVPLERAST